MDLTAVEKIYERELMDQVEALQEELDLLSLQSVPMEERPQLAQARARKLAAITSVKRMLSQLWSGQGAAVIQEIRNVELVRISVRLNEQCKAGAEKYPDRAEAYLSSMVEADPSKWAAVYG